MDAGQALDLMNGMMWNGLIVAAPMLLAILLVGLAVSVLQVTTQIQEITLSYVPKILTAALMMIVVGPWMLERVNHFATSLYLIIPELAR